MRVHVHPKKVFHVVGPADLEGLESFTYTLADASNTPVTADSWESSDTFAIPIDGAGVGVAGDVAVDTDVDVRGKKNGKLWD